MDQTHGESVHVRVTAISDLSMTLDANHPLAGRAITFELLRANILPRPAIEEELNT